MVPRHLRDPLRLWIERGTPTGSGLRGVLSNAPIQHVLALDEQSFAGLPDILRFLHNYAPSACHGSEAHVGAWRELGGLTGYLKKRRDISE